MEEKVKISTLFKIGALVEQVWNISSLRLKNILQITQTLPLFTMVIKTNYLQK